MERMDEYRMVRRVLMAYASRWRVRGKLMLGWMDGVKVALGGRGMTVEAERQCAKDKDWRALVHMAMLEFNAIIIAWPSVLSDRPPALWQIITWRGVGCRYMMRLG